MPMLRSIKRSLYFCCTPYSLEVTANFVLKYVPDFSYTDPYATLLPKLGTKDQKKEEKGCCLQ